MLLNPILEISDLVDQHKHAKALSEHIAEGRFPLDGSDWARQVAMRLLWQRTKRTETLAERRGLWLKLHSADTPIFHQRKAYQRAILHWFSYGNEEYNNSWRFNSTNLIDDPYWKHVIDNIGREVAPGIDMPGAKNKKLVNNHSGFWIEVDREGSEGAPTGHKRITSYR